MNPASERKTEIVIVGGGAGGSELAAVLGRRHGRSTLNVTLVDCATRHLWKPRLHEVAAGLIGMGEDETSYLALARANHFRFRLGALIGIDPQAKTISLGAVKDFQGGELLGERVVHYDTLVLAFGSEVNDFGVEGVAEHCHMLDSGDQALSFQRNFLEQAVRVSDETLDRVSIGIVGAGATGVELAAELHHAVNAIHRFGGLMSLEQLDITLVDRAPRVLANNDPSTSAFAMRVLEKMGVKVRLNAGVERVTTEGLILKGGDFVPCALKVWASGVIGRSLVTTLPLQVDSSRRLICDEHLRCKGIEDVYALGDCATIIDPATQRPLPATAQVAHQQASYLVPILSKRARAATAKPFAYRPMGTLISLGTEPAAGELSRRSHGSITFRGIVPKFLYHALQLVHRATLIGWARAMTLAFVDRLRKTTAPPVKLH